MAIDERRSNVERRSGKDRRNSGVDIRTEEEKKAVGERRSSIDRRSGVDRRSGAALASAPDGDRDDSVCWSVAGVVPVRNGEAFLNRRVGYNYRRQCEVKKVEWQAEQVG